MRLNLLRVLSCTTALLVSCCGCATRTVSFGSDPTGAIIHVDGKEFTTPCEVEISRKTPSAQIELEGYVNQSIDLTKNKTPLPISVLCDAASAPAALFKLSGAVVGCVGVAGIIVYAIANNDDDDDSFDDDEDSDFDSTWFWTSAGLTAVGSLVFAGGEGAGEWLHDKSTDDYFVELRQPTPQEP